MNLKNTKFNESVNKHKLHKGYISSEKKIDNVYSVSCGKVISALRKRYIMFIHLVVENSRQ